MVPEAQVLELLVDSRDFRRWSRMASALCLSVPEYIRRCTTAHTTILEHDSFNIVPGPRVKENKDASVAQ